jgi:hypothetical protein
MELDWIFEVTTNARLQIDCQYSGELDTEFRTCEHRYSVCDNAVSADRWLAVVRCERLLLTRPDRPDAGMFVDRTGATRVGAGVALF